MTNNILECVKQYRIIVALRYYPDKVVAMQKPYMKVVFVCWRLPSTRLVRGTY